MTEIEQELDKAMRDSAREALDDRGRERAAEALNSWLAFTARKKPMPDLAQRLETFRKRIQVLVDSLAIEVGPAGYVVRASGDAESTLQMLERGTDWFDPPRDVTGIILGAVFEQRS